jgi:hypothetical protein
MTTPPVDTAPPIWWRVHDIVVGFLSGFGVGTIAGLYLTNLVGTNVMVPICAAVAAALGILILIQNHRGARRFLNAVVVASWVLLVLSAVFIGLLIFAILNFE